MKLAPFLALACLAIPAMAAEDIRLSGGLKQYQVLQRSPEGVARVAVKGTIAGKKLTGKEIEARVLGPRGVLPDFAWMPAGVIQKTDWTAEVKGVPTGGPYRFEFRMQGGTEIVAVDNVLVGDLWILAGQSNMEGVGDLVDIQQPDPLVNSFDQTDRWLEAQEPLHTLVNAADRVHWRRNTQGEYEALTGDALRKYLQDRKKGAGLGLPFAVELVKRTGIPVGLIPCAHGGTSMDQWDPKLKDREGDSLYGSMYRRFVAAGGRVKGVLWYQGESDASAKAAPEFRRKFEALVAAIRSDFAQPNLPFYYVQIGRHISNANQLEWNQVQEQQRQAEQTIPHSGMVAAVDFTLDDGIHVSTQDQKRLGRRLADRVCHDLFPTVNKYGEMKTGPQPVSAVLDNGVVKVKFSGVNGRLLSEGRISGFTIHDEAGKPIPQIFKMRIDPAEANTVLLYMAAKLPEHTSVWYGFGKDPYCNLRDAADMAVPVFGPLEIKQ